MAAASSARPTWPTNACAAQGEAWLGSGPAKSSGCGAAKWREQPHVRWANAHLAAHQADDCQQPVADVSHLQSRQGDQCMRVGLRASRRLGAGLSLACTAWQALPQHIRYRAPPAGEPCVLAASFPAGRKGPPLQQTSAAGGTRLVAAAAAAAHSCRAAHHRSGAPHSHRGQAGERQRAIRRLSILHPHGGEQRLALLLCCGPRHAHARPHRADGTW